MKRTRLRRSVSALPGKPTESKVADYLSAVESCERAVSLPSLLQVANARHSVGKDLEDDEDAPLELLEQLAAVDERAKRALARSPALLVKEFETLRDVSGADSKKWWWDTGTWRSNKNEPAWLLGTAAFWGLALALTSDTVSRWLVGGPDWTTMVAVVVQAAVALVGGAAFVDWGRRKLQSAAAFRGRSVGEWPILAFGLAVAAVCFVLAIRAALPWFALFYDEQGRHHFEGGRLESALSSWRRASALDPDSWIFHYEIGSVYDRLADVDKAIAEYRVAVSSAEAAPAVYNNLARLYIVSKSDYASALTLLDPALTKHAAADVQRYRMLVNRGSAFLGLKQYRLAEFDASAAELIASKLDWRKAPSTACLKHQVSSATQKPIDRQNVLDCVTPQQGDVVSDPRWISGAREWLLANPQ